MDSIYTPEGPKRDDFTLFLENLATRVSDGALDPLLADILKDEESSMPYLYHWLKAFAGDPEAFMYGIRPMKRSSSPMLNSDSSRIPRADMVDTLRSLDDRYSISGFQLPFRGRTSELNEVQTRYWGDYIWHFSGVGAHIVIRESLRLRDDLGSIGSRWYLYQFEDSMPVSSQNKRATVGYDSRLLARILNEGNSLVGFTDNITFPISVNDEIQLEVPYLMNGVTVGKIPDLLVQSALGMSRLLWADQDILIMFQMYQQYKNTGKPRFLELIEETIVERYQYGKVQHRRFARRVSAFASKINRTFYRNNLLIDFINH